MYELRVYSGPLYFHRPLGARFMYHCRRQPWVNCLRAFSAEFVTFTVHIPIAVWPRTNKRFLNRAPDVTSTNSLVSIFVFISLYRITYEAHESRFIFMT